MNEQLNIIDSVLESNDLGAGNFLHMLCGTMPNSRKKLIYLGRQITGPDGSPTKALSPSELNEMSAQIAAWYISQGVGRKELVVLFFSEGIEYLAHFLALNRIGAIPVFINSRLKAGIVIDFIARIRAGRLIVDEERVGQIRAAASENSFGLKIYLLSEIELTLSVDTTEPVKLCPTDTVLLAHTSGTTGTPKAVQFSHHGFYFGVKQQLRKMFGGKIFSALPHSHASSISIMMSTLLRGSEIWVQTNTASEDVLLNIEEFRPDLVIAFPKVLADLCRHDLINRELTSVRVWMSTGDSNHEAHIRKLIGASNKQAPDRPNEAPPVFVDNLGSSEFGFAICRNVHTPSTDKYNRCIGKPFDWVDLAVLQDDGSEASDFQVGMLGVKSPSVTPGYWNDSNTTERTRLAGYWLTGDLVYRASDGNIFHVDRTADPIKTKGGVIYSCQTEELLLANFDEIFDCSIVGRSRGELTLVVLMVEFKEGVQVGADEFLIRINELLLSKKIPQIDKIEIEPSHSYTGVTGKRLKRELRKLDSV